MSKVYETKCIRQFRDNQPFDTNAKFKTDIIMRSISFVV